MRKKSVLEVGFEPTPPERLELESSALDHSAIQAGGVQDPCMARGGVCTPLADQRPAGCILSLRVELHPSKV